MGDNIDRKTKIKVLMVAPEVVPFAGTGGLGEVIGSLPEAMAAQTDDIDIRVIMPLYGQVDQKLRKKMKFIGWTEIVLGWRKQYVGVFTCKHKGVVHYFIDNEYYFKRDWGIYGYYDECERFAFFSKAVLDCLPLIGFEPDIIHAHDWQTALVPVYQSVMEHYPPRKVIFTIHNVEYQGRYGMDLMEKIMGIDMKHSHILEYNKDVNLMKGAIETAHLVTTVSPNYARELTDPFYAHGIDPIIRKNRNKLVGIVNGIDTETYDPWTDDLTFAKYSVTAPARKKRNKEGLQKMMNLPVAPDVPVMSIISRLVEHKGMDLIMGTLERLIYEEEFQLVVLGTGDVKYQNFFKEMAYKYPDRVAANIMFSRDLSHKVYAGADVLLMPSKSEPCGLSQMIACRYGVVPLVRETGGLSDTIKDCTLGKGEGVVFANYTTDDFYGAFKRMCTLYKDSVGWKKLVKHNMRLRNGWDVSAAKYEEVYRNLYLENR